jgi:hypothetical protein
LPDALASMTLLACTVSMGSLSGTSLMKCRGAGWWQTDDVSDGRDAASAGFGPGGAIGRAVGAVWRTRS